MLITPSIWHFSTIKYVNVFHYFIVEIHFPYFQSNLQELQGVKLSNLLMQTDVYSSTTSINVLHTQF
uniref:Uncharacterized protein n=1 Tax=Lepeophtheirus salmonis TaxID=72036 RepID=A0A0K2TSK2_LEPSM